MCSRFENKESGESIFKRLKNNFHGEVIYDIENWEEFPSEKIAPTDKIIAVMRKNNALFIKSTQWGIKFDDTKKFPVVFNSRLETLNSKKFWGTLFNNNRCVIPATAFFEWVQTSEGKVPQRIHSDDELFYIAGINFFKDEIVYSSMITTTPNAFMKNLHNRMPILFNETDALEFLFASGEDAMNICKKVVSLNLSSNSHSFDQFNLKKT
ncbi:MAG: SOS response-associated peptidase family protein [Ignavibacteriaceae bacterium]|jgi:Uncharacterized conserved protein|nr:MAG: hypothetical protein EDM69_09130 [Chlorobiota bacterium]KXK03211.1 MAG: putative SOS response-associated peptidase YedK [Chlorobi bacterium OLB4]MBV6399668.1 putative SOS response-associated peptidase YedK [Ignavibacteria bacterium]MCC6885660.1 SOS response-associated peptidase family protein [Ignavibacteriales bacterium]MCE7953824.1 hypothetical protein [Chlorobi bacterium CHB7]MDL1887758.1 SOS response-associated peptidase [Ignavibacteria bacterium CHB1]MEB2330380.1 SOS response-ass